MIKFWKITILVLVAVLLITLGIIFIPGFFRNRQTSAPASKTQSSVESASLLGLDKSVKSAHFTIYFAGDDEKSAQNLINICEKDYPTLTKFFPETPMTEILIT